MAETRGLMLPVYMLPSVTVNCDLGSNACSILNEKRIVLGVPKFVFSSFFIIAITFASTTNVVTIISGHFYHHSLPVHSLPQFPRNFCTLYLQFDHHSNSLE